MIRTRRAALAQSGNRFSEKIVLKEESNSPPLEKGRVREGIKPRALRAPTCLLQQTPSLFRERRDEELPHLIAISSAVRCKTRPPSAPLAEAADACAETRK